MTRKNGGRGVGGTTVQRVASVRKKEEYARNSIRIIFSSNIVVLRPTLANGQDSVGYFLSPPAHNKTAYS